MQISRNDWAFGTLMHRREDVVGATIGLWAHKSSKSGARIFSIFIVAILFAHSAICLAGSTYYVDYVSGLDSNNGLVKSRPWKRVPGMDNQTTGKALLPGDTICLKGGVTWVDRLVANTGVTYRGDCAAWGQGRANIFVPAVARSFAAFYCAGCDNVTIQGINFSNALVSASYQGAAYVEGSATNSVTNFAVNNCSFINSGQGLMLRKYTVGGTVNNVEAYNNTYPATLANANASGILISGPGTSNISVDGAVLHDNGKTTQASGINEGRGITISGGVTAVTLINVNAYGNSAANGEEGSAIEIADASYIDISRSRFVGATAAEIKNSANNLTITKNLFSGTSAGVFQYGYYAGRDSVGSKINNNTIISTRNLNNAAVKLSSPGTTNEFRGNIIILPSGHTGAALEFNTVGTYWSPTTWDNRIDNNQIFGGVYYSITVEVGSVFRTRTLAQHQVAFPLQAGTDITTTGK